MLPLLGVCILSGVALAGPVHDPFVEKFQVGTWTRPEAIALAGGYPEGLLEPARLDTAWTRAASAVLSTDGEGSEAGLALRLVRALHPDDGGAAWLAAARAALADLEAGRAGDRQEPFLLPERLTLAFGSAVAAGDQVAAAGLAAELAARATDLGLEPREQLIWELRHRCARQLAHDPLPADQGLWPVLQDLGSFDTGNAWVLWVAMRRQADLPVLPAGEDPAVLGGVLGRLGNGWFAAAELYGADLPAEWQAGLGGILLAEDELAEHFRRFPDPPADFDRQGWWVRGQRRLRAGQAPAYEQLADRLDLKPGWRLDLWRRASELRLLKGAWVEGLSDLEQALALAKAGHGTNGQRLRLRQWVEQALALALANDDLATARRVRDLGLEGFSAAEAADFATEIRHWSVRLDNSAPPGPVSADPVDQFRYRIETGDATPVAPVTPKHQADFLAAADQALWATWYKWGLALADPEPVNGERRARAVAYGTALAAALAADRTADLSAGQSAELGALATEALGIVALRLGDRPWVAQLLRKAVDVDAERRCGWRTPPQPSPVPSLLPFVRGSELDRHALLGFCLATGDMRGTLGLAYELPGTGLTRAEKRLFLYPLPGDGPVREAICAAGNEPALLLAVARNESLFEPAVRSRAGALGWMQIMPFHYPENGALFGAGNWRIPAMSVQRGDGLLTENRRRYGGDPYRLLAAYNAGPGAASRWDRQLGGDAAPDVYLAWIGYPETRAYVEKVLIDREMYNAIIGARTGAATVVSPNE